MSGAIFWDTLRSNWRQMLSWGIGVGFLGVFLVIAIPDVDALQQYAAIVDVMPPAMLQMIGLEDAAQIATPEGFLSFGVYGYGVLILAVFAVMAGLSVAANEEDEGIMDVLLSLPVPRWRLIVERLVAYVLITIGIIIVFHVMVWLGLSFSTYEIDMGRVAELTINIVPITLMMIALTAFLSVMIRSKSTATSIASAFIVGSYFLNFVAEAASGTLADISGSLSIFNYYDNNGVMTHGLNVGNMALLLVVALVLAAGSVWAFERRDIGG